MNAGSLDGALVAPFENMSTSLVRQLWMKLRRFVLSARWSDAGPGQEGR